MRSTLRIRWIVAVCVWLAALGLTWANLAGIDRVTAVRKTNESLRKEIYFQRQNVQRLEQVAARHAALFMPMESLDLGVVAVRYRIGALAAGFHLEDMVIDAEMNQVTDGRIPCKLSMIGEFENLVGFLTALGQYPYLIPRQTGIRAVAGNAAMSLEMTIHIQYKIAAPIPPVDAVPQVTTQPLSPEGRPL